MRFKLSSDTLFTKGFLRINIAIGLTITVIALYLIFTGEYPSMKEREAREIILNRFAVGGLIYMGLVWSACQLSKPFMKRKSQNH